MSGRGPVPGLASPHPMGERLPAMYLEDGFVQGMLGALDEVLAPVLCSLDNLESYFDPDLAPGDFLEWLGGWVGLAMDESWPIERRRSLVTETAALYRTRGTAAGMAAHLRLLTGAEVEIEETGGTAYSTSANPQTPGQPGFQLLVRLRVPAGPVIDAARVDQLVAAAKPAHVVHHVAVVAGSAEG
jgi:phage tail-like protein